MSKLVFWLAAMALLCGLSGCIGGSESGRERPGAAPAGESGAP